MAGTHPAWATPAHRACRAPVTRGVVRARVYLAPRDAAGLAAAATAVSTPGRPDYRHFLSPAQLQARFGQRPAQVAAVRAWLRRAGPRVTGVSDHVADGYLAVTGPVSRGQRVRGPVPATGWPGRAVRAPERAVSVPRAVAGSVLDVSGLSTARHHAHDAGRHAAAARPELLGRPAVRVVLRSEDRDHEPAAYGSSQPWRSAATPRRRSAASTG